MSKAEESTHSMNIPIEWHVPDNIQSRYASNVFVQPGQYEIILSFFETLPPLLTGSPEENRTKLQELGAVRADCVARVIINPDLIPKLIQALQSGLDGYIAGKSAEEGEVDL